MCLGIFQVFSLEAPTARYHSEDLSVHSLYRKNYKEVICFSSDICSLMAKNGYINHLYKDRKIGQPVGRDILVPF